MISPLTYTCTSGDASAGYASIDLDILREVTLRSATVFTSGPRFAEILIFDRSGVEICLAQDYISLFNALKWEGNRTMYISKIRYKVWDVSTSLSIDTRFQVE